MRNESRQLPSAALTQSRYGIGVALVAILLAILGVSVRDAAAGVIFVTTTEQKISETGGCSLQEAIYSANFNAKVAISGYSGNGPIPITTQCAPGDGDDVIVLPTGAVFELSKIVGDASNPFGPTATPIITSNITIEAHGATLQHTGDEYFRAFAVGSSGHLTIRNAYLTGFVTHGGNGGRAGGGGMGAGGAIYVHAGGLVVEASTFEGNGAIGGDGGASDGSVTFGGGGGLGGDGQPDGQFTVCQGGGGGGGARGNGAAICIVDGITGRGGGGGGGTLRNGSGGGGGFDCGGDGGLGNQDGQDAPCPGGGGGGGGMSTLTGSGDGGKGNYGGGGGGGSDGGGNGGNGGFGGGGGSGWAGTFGGSSGGRGGFGGGGGAGPNGSVTDGTPGLGGMFGGDANHENGGGGAALGGAIFNDAGNVAVKNSTFSGNFVSRGNGGGAPNPGQAANGRDAGGAIFSRNGHLTVQYSTISGNEATGSGGGIVVARDGADTYFTLQNTIIANNGATECSIEGAGVTTDFKGNLIEANDNCGDPVATADPQLGSLQNNQGPTPTMAIPKTSPAFNAADNSVTLPRDQRGQERPAEGDLFDIGAFELCLDELGFPCIIIGGIGESDFVQLTVQISPADSGTTTPAPGTHNEPLNSVVLLTATPNTSYRFVNWTGGPVTVPTSALTTVIMDQARTVTANFELFDFNFSPISPLTLAVGSSGSRTVTVNSMGAFDQPVTLSLSGQPSGSSPSLNPTSVTPPAGGSASSQLNVILGPSVLPGSYTFNVNGASGALTHSTPVSLTVQATPDSVTQVIETLQALGCIDNAGVGNAFSIKLAQAQAAIDAGDIQTAINILTALLQQLQAQAGKHLITSCTDSNGVSFDPVQVLIDDVKALLASLGVNLKPNPVMGSLVNSSNSEISGATVSILNSAKTVVASAKTDVTGFYFFAKTSGLKLGLGYAVKVTLPKGYKISTPASQTFEWRGTEITLSNFVLN